MLGKAFYPKITIDQQIIPYEILSTVSVSVGVMFHRKKKSSKQIQGEIVFLGFPWQRKMLFS